MPKTIIFDTETTGLEAPEIIEAAWLEVNSLAPMTYGACFEQRYRPSKPISIAALATHHILDEELVDCPTSSEFALPQHVDYLIGHNIDFDWTVIGMPDVRRICTLSLARAVWPSTMRNNGYKTLMRPLPTFVSAQQYWRICAKRSTLARSSVFGNAPRMHVFQRICLSENIREYQL